MFAETFYFCVVLMILFCLIFICTMYIYRVMCSAVMYSCLYVVVLLTTNIQRVNYIARNAKHVVHGRHISAAAKRSICYHILWRDLQY